MKINLDKNIANKAGIYIIANTIDERAYIGSAIRLRKRKDLHILKLNKKEHHSKHLQNFTNKYGIDSLIFSVVEVVENVDKLIEREQYYLDTLEPSFNMCKIANSVKGIKRTDEFKRKVSERNKGRKLSEDAKKKKSEAMKEYWALNMDKYEKLRSINKNKTFKHTKESITKMVQNNRKRLPIETINEIVNLKEQGLKNKDISSKLNINRNTITKYLKINKDEL